MHPSSLARVSHDTLDEFQAAAVHAPLGPVAMLAGPGAGKTHTVVARIGALVDGGVEPTRIVALCHTQKAAGELRDRLVRRGLGEVACATIHALAWRQLRECYAEVHDRECPELVASAWGLVRDACVAELGAARVEPAVVHEVLAELDWARASGLDRRRYAGGAKKAGRGLNIKPTELTGIWRRVDERKERAQLVEFCDVLALATGLYEHPEVAARLRARHEVLVVDEYQDVDATQQGFLEAVLGDRDTLTVVGDADQAIFRFKGGDPSLLTGFAGRWPGAQVVELVRNYRSSPEIVAWVNRLASAGRAPLVAVGPSGPRPRIVAAVDEGGEEHALIHQLRRWQAEGVPAEEIAVLYRFNATAARLEAALAAAGISYHVAGAQRFFERPEVRAVLVPFGQTARREPDADGVTALLDAAVAQGHDRVRAPEGMGALRQRWEAVEALCQLAGTSFAGRSAAALLAELQERARATMDVTPGGVCLATVHAAKGREWDAVWVCGMTEGQMPSSFATTGAALAEERNVAYVALSRARRHLVASFAWKRANGWSQKPSRYLEVLGFTGEDPRGPRTKRASSNGPGRGRGDRDRYDRHDQYEQAGEPARSSLRPEPPQRGGCARCGERLGSIAAREAQRCSAACLDGRLAARHGQLEAWRAERAAALGVPPERVASTRTLFSLAVCGTSVPTPGLHPKAGPLPA